MASQLESVFNRTRFVPRTFARWQRPGTRVFSRRVAKETFFIPILLAHIPLGLALYSSSALAFLHPLSVFALGLYWAMQKKAPIERVAYTVAYMVASEVLWRMANAPIFWETAKYGTTVIMIVALISRGLTKIPKLPLVYLFLLIPACALTFILEDWVEFRDKLSFNMSGPICLFASCCFFSQIRFSGPQIKKLTLIMMAPITSIAITTLFYTVASPDIQFTNESNLITSGGFGPNQVSAVLGLGVFVAVLAFLSFRNNFGMIVLLGGLTLLFAVQSMLTFSRGGIYTAAGALLLVTLFQARQLGEFVKRFIPVIIIAAIFFVLIFPSLDAFTGGKLEERFESTDTTNRFDLVTQDLEVFSANPILGAGVGRSANERWVISHHYALNHTEFTRLLSEHGLLGIFAILLIGLATYFNLKRQNRGMEMAFVAGTIGWSCLYMMTAGMRIAAPAFMCGLSFVTILGSTSLNSSILRKSAR